MGPANNDRARWYLPILHSRTVIMHDTQSRLNNDIEAMRAGKMPWYELMQRPGLVLKRPNPAIDPADTAPYSCFIWPNGSTSFLA